MRNLDQLRLQIRVRLQSRYGVFAIKAFVNTQLIHQYNAQNVCNGRIVLNSLNLVLHATIFRKEKERDKSNKAMALSFDKSSPNT